MEPNIFSIPRNVRIRKVAIIAWDKEPQLKKSFNMSKIMKELNIDEKNEVIIDENRASMENLYENVWSGEKMFPRNIILQLIEQIDICR